MATYDFAIIGLGIYGAGLAYQLSRRGYNVVGFDRYNPPHAQASSHGGTRIFRRVPFEGAPYIDLMAASIAETRAFEEITGQTYMFETGGLDIAWENDARLTDVPRFCRDYDLPYEIIDSSEIKKRYPIFSVPEGMNGIVQPYSGYMKAESLWQDFLTQARMSGFEMRVFAPVERVVQGDDGIVAVHAAGEVVHARQAIVTLGSYLPALIEGMGKTVKILRQLVAWFDVPEYLKPASELSPVFTFRHAPAARLYGIPSVNGRGVKLGWHNVHEDMAIETDPLNSPAVTEEEINRMMKYMKLVMPSLADKRPEVEKCLYTSTDDENFIVDTVPGRENVHVLSCCSGHGFKFAAGITRVFADKVSGKDDGQLLSSFASINRRQSSPAVSP